MGKVTLSVKKAPFSQHLKLNLVQIAKQVHTHTHTYGNTHRRSMLSEQWVQTPHALSLSHHPSLPASLYLQRYNEPCCTVLFTPASYQWYSSTETANWRGQATVLPVPCSGVGVYRHAPSTFLSRLRKDWVRARLPLTIIKHTHTNRLSLQ